MPDFGTAVATLGLAGRTMSDAKDLADQFGFFHDDVTVTVWGNPRSSKKDLFKIAAGLAFSMARRLGPTSVFHPAPGSITTQYDAAQKYVTFNVKYNVSLAAVVAASALPGRPNMSTLSETLPVFGGIRDTFVGDKWSFLGTGLGPGGGGGPGGADRFRVPDLKRWEKHIILTDADVSTPPVEVDGGNIGDSNEPTMNPRPWRDNRSRASFADLIFSALSTPGTDYDLTYPEPAVGRPNADARSRKPFEGE